MVANHLHEESAYPLILIVDDDPALCSALQEIFEFSGYTVLTVSNAQDALHILRTSQPRPSLIISDVLMSEMDGYQFYHAVRAEEKWRDIPFIFLSAKSKLRHDVEQRGLKVHGYVTKPFRVEDLLSTVSELIQH